MNRSLLLLAAVLAAGLLITRFSETVRHRPQNSGPTAAAADASAAAASAAADSPAAPLPDRFSAVGRRLDPAGSMYLYLDVKDVARDWLREAAATAPDEAAAIAASVDRVLDTLGIYAVEDLGVSVVKQDATSRTKAFLRVPGERKGLFAAVGAEPHEFDLLAYAPPDTVLFRSMDLDLPEVLGLARRVAEAAGGAAALTTLNRWIETLGTRLGVDLEAAADSLAGELAVIVALDPEESIVLPIDPAAPLECPAPRLAVIATVKDSALFDAVRNSLVERDVEIREASAGDLRKVFIPASGEGPFPMKPVIAFDGGRFFFATHDAFLSAMEAARATGADLRGCDEFREVTAGLPSAGNGFMFVSRRLPAEIRKVAQRLSAMRQTSGEQGAGPAGAMMFAWQEAAVAFVRVNQPDGVWFVAAGPAGGSSKVLLSHLRSLLPSLMGGSSGKPPELEPGGDVARAASDLRTLAAALEAYYIDANLYPPAVDAAGTPLPCKIDGSVVSNGYVPWMLTTPIAYLARLPADPHRLRDDGSESPPFRYATNGRSCWIAAGNGPDGDEDVDIAAFPARDQGKCSWTFFAGHLGFGTAVEYDPTNGVASSGDILRVGP